MIYIQIHIKLFELALSSAQHYQTPPDTPPHTSFPLTHVFAYTPSNDPYQPPPQSLWI